MTVVVIKDSYVECFEALGVVDGVDHASFLKTRRVICVFPLLVVPDRFSFWHLFL